MSNNYIANPHWAGESVNVFCGQCEKNPGNIIIPPKNFIICVECAAKQEIVLPAIERISQKAAIRFFAMRGIKVSRTTIYRWCRDGLLPAAWDELAESWRPYRDGVENFTPPKRGPKHRKTAQDGLAQKEKTLTLLGMSRQRID